MKEKIVLHIGLPKTGTTFLQNEIYPKLENVNYIKSISINLQLDPDKINLISSEGLSGSYLPAQPNNKQTNRFVIADRLKALFPDARIIIALREPESFCKSFYSQHIRAKGCLSFEKFRETFFKNYFVDMDKYIDYLESLFDDVFVYNFEDFRDNPVHIVSKICEFIGCPMVDFDNVIHNASFKERQLNMLRFFNWVTKHLNYRYFVYKYFNNGK